MLRPVAAHSPRASPSGRRESARMPSHARVGVLTKLAMPAGLLVIIIMVVLLLAIPTDLSRFTSSRRLQQLTIANSTEVDWNIIPSDLELDPRLQRLLDSNNMSISTDALDSQTQDIARSNGIADAPGPQKYRSAGVNGQSACSSQLQIPKVAMLFLTRGPLYHAQTWKHWFREAEGLVPYSVLGQGACRNATLPAATVPSASLAPGSNRRMLIQWPSWTGLGQKGEKCWCEDAGLQALQSTCMPHDTPFPLQRQHLFNVYVHTQPNFTGFSQENVFYGYEIADRVEVTWGTMTMVDAARNMLREALKDPLNQKMMMLSESGVPLWPPQFVYQQLLAENRSRLDSCGLKWTDPSRWSARMSIPGGLRRHEFRKSSQWFALRRDHAELVLDEQQVYERFEKYCVPGWDKDYRRDRWCFSDEHYIPTLIATSQLGHETDCEGHLVSVDWRGINGPHPRSYKPEETDSILLEALRQADGCNSPDEGMRTARSNLLDLRDSAPGESLCGRKAPIPIYTEQIEPQCPLFARKFPVDTAYNVLRSVASCSSRLGLTSQHSCVKSDLLPADDPNDGISSITKSLKLKMNWFQPKQEQSVREKQPIYSDAS